MEAMKGGKLLLMRGRGFKAAFIRWYTRSKYAHCAFLYPDGQTIVESYPGRGVHITKLKDWDGITTCEVPGMTDEQWVRLFAWAESKVGAKYDWPSIFSFLMRNKPDSDDKWFCSEFCHAAFKAAGYPILTRVDSFKVYPGLLSYSPLVTVSRK